MPNGLILSVFIINCLRNAPIRLIGKGNRVMNYIDARDIAKAVLCSVEHPDVSGLFLLNGTSISNIDLARLCINVINSKSVIEFSGDDDPQDAQRWIIDGSKAENLLGFTAQITVEQTIRDISESLR